MVEPPHEPHQEPADGQVGVVGALWRYPVKSMAGQELASTGLSSQGLHGDRTHAVLDAVDGEVASAKDTRRWPRLFEFTAACLGTPGAGAPSPVRITLPGGETLLSGQHDASDVLSRAMDRPARLTSSAERFFDDVPVHVVTTATLQHLHELHPPGEMAVRRFRPNIVVETPATVRGFAENDWVDRTLRVGDDVALAVVGPCPRCVMVTLAQPGLPRDRGVLRTAARHNDANVGVYARVLSGGQVHRGDRVRLE